MSDYSTEIEEEVERLQAEDMRNTQMLIQHALKISELQHENRELKCELDKTKTDLQAAKSEDGLNRRTLAMHAEQIDELYAENRELERELAELMAQLNGATPKTHVFWGAGEPECPPELLAPNMELHTLQCKVCGLISPRSQSCGSPEQEFKPSSRDTSI